MTEYELDVDGMSCGGCESNVEAAIADLDGTIDVAADHEADRVEVSGEPGLEDELRAAVREAGYDPV
jgi:copper chaperone